MLANSEFIVMLNQAPTDRIELAKLLNISETQLSYITNAEAGQGLIKCMASIVPFTDKFPKGYRAVHAHDDQTGRGKKAEIRLSNQSRRDDSPRLFAVQRKARIYEGDTDEAGYG